MWGLWVLEETPEREQRGNLEQLKSPCESVWKAGFVDGRALLFMNLRRQCSLRRDHSSLLVGWQEWDACLIVQSLTALGVRATEAQF